MREADPRVEKRVRAALELIERAQHDLERAQAELSAIVGAAALWTRVGHLSWRAHLLWRNLSYHRRRRLWTLDGIHADEKP